MTWVLDVLKVHSRGQILTFHINSQGYFSRFCKNLYVKCQDLTPWVVPIILSFLPFPTLVEAIEFAYVGVKVCKGCHYVQYLSWQETSMANAFELLKPGVRAEEKLKAGLDPNKDYTHDRKCIGCHTTGYGKAGGFVGLEFTPDLVGVQCEMCHGPGSEYVKIMKKKFSFAHSEVDSVGHVPLT